VIPRSDKAAWSVALAGVCLCVWLATVPAATGHIVLGDPTLQLLMADADVAARARITDVREVPAASDTVGQRPTVGAVLLEVLKGDVASKQVRFAQHGHGVASYRPGEEVLLFLRRIERSRELDTLAATGLAYVSLQEHDDKYLVPAGEDPLVMRVARAYSRAERVADPDARLKLTREVMLMMLRSQDARLAAEAVQTLAIAEGDALVTSQELPELLQLIDDSRTPIGVRIALLVELERRGMLAGSSRWLGLLQATSGAERKSVIRAAGRHPSVELGTALLALLEGEDLSAAREAAIAVGWPGYDAAVAPLGTALAGEDARLRMAAIRGLGGVATAEAQRMLAASASEHPDDATRRRAGAEVRRLELRHGVTNAGEGAEEGAEEGVGRDAR